MAAGTVSAKVRRIFLFRRTLVALESASLGVAAAILTLASVRLGASVGVGAQAAAAAVLTAMFASASWWLERREDPEAVARGLDRSARLRGALVTTFEVEQTRSTSGVAGLLAVRTARAVRTRPYVRAEGRRSLATLAAPFLALAAWSASARPAVGPGADSRDGGQVAARALTAERLVRESSALLAATPPDGPEAETARELHRQAMDLRRRAPEPESVPGRFDAGARALARALRAAEEPDAAPGVTSGDPQGTMEDPRPATDGAPDASMPSVPPATTATPSLPGASGSEGGVGEMRWWSERYDGLVDRWMESRRRLRSDSPHD